MINYEKDIIIDETALDVEWLEQASLAIKYAKHYLKCKDIVAKAEVNLKTVKNELIATAYQDPNTCLGKGVKPTAITLEMFWSIHPDYIEAHEELLEAQHECDLAEIIKNEISFTRKAALENLVTLHGQNYFAGPTVPRNLHEQVEQRRLKRAENAQRVRSKNN